MAPPIRRKFSVLETGSPRYVLARKKAIAKSIYLGVAVSYDDQGQINWACSSYDGVEFESHEDTFHGTAGVKGSEQLNQLNDIIIRTVSDYATSHNYRIQGVCIGCDESTAKIVASDPKFKDPIRTMCTRFWFDLDAVPCIYTLRGMSLTEEAASAARKVFDWFTPQFPGSIPRIAVDPDTNEVLVDMDGHCHMIDLKHFEDTTDKPTWDKLLQLSEECKQRKLRILFFNSTPQGGGVALMRHATIRLMRLLGVDCRWFVAKPNPDVFVITKRKFHNVFQGVTQDEQYRLQQDDKNLWVEWCNENFDRYWGEGKDVVESADVIIMDDPQVSAIIPRIRKLNPGARIIYRSHIEIRADLASVEGSMQYDLWDFLWGGFIQSSDVFISHPVAGFIPPRVPHSKVALMPAATDELDGLNKRMSAADLEYYRRVFNRCAEDQGSPGIASDRPYVIQIARFDPAKGIPDVIEAYRGFREQLNAKGIEADQQPQLVLCGHGSIDDPDGTVVYEQVIQLLTQPEYAPYAKDICVARLPASDQLLCAILRGSFCALQLSHREGFEVKVTESLSKYKPVIAYRSGGIPLQIEDGKTGILVERGNTKGVSDALTRLYTDQAYYQDFVNELRTKEQDSKRQQYFTPFQSVNWLYLATQLAFKGNDEAVARNQPSGNVEGTYLGNGEVRQWNARYVREYWQNTA
ncbi:UDP-Glycosyltransferase/glycogen phosphorylase [Martensiomyces pterosporus]|nr:UDP-Glycosyltransferase/glycogen phosphorylase [Martensiomyces pterosporus]